MPKKCEERMKPGDTEKYRPVKCNQELKPLTFPHILPHIIFLCVGLLLGTMAFLMEICIKKGKMGNNSIILHHLLYLLNILL